MKLKYFSFLTTALLAYEYEDYQIPEYNVDDYDYSSIESDFDANEIKTSVLGTGAYTPQSSSVTALPTSAANTYKNASCVAKMNQLTVDYMTCLTGFAPCGQTKPKDVKFEKCNAADLDLIFLIDGSTSVGRNNFTEMKHFIKRVINHFDVSPGKSRVAMMQYSTYPTKEWGLTDYQYKNQVFQAVDNLRWKTGDTHTAAALEALRTQIIAPIYNYGNTMLNRPKAIIVITDGDPQDYQQVPRAVKMLHKYQLNIYAVGIGDATQTELAKLAFDPAAPNDAMKNVYSAKTYHDALYFENMISRKVCRNANNLQGTLKRLKEMILDTSEFGY